MTNGADLLEAAVTFVVTVKSSWSTVEMIVQASDDITKVVPKNEDSLVTSTPELTEVNLSFTLIQ